MAGIVDTSAVFALERRDLGPGDSLQTHFGDDVAIASITASELLVGVYRAKSTARRHQRGQFVEWVFRELPILSFDLEVARVHARLITDLVARGQPIGRHDLIIAATALAHARDVTTLDMRSFPQVPGLSVQRPISG